MLGINPLSRFVTISMTLLFIIIFISEWRTWIGTFTFAEQKRLKRIRKKLEKRNKLSNKL